MATYLSMAMAIKRDISPPPKKCIRNIWAMQPHNEIDLHFIRKSAITLGVATEERHKSKNDKFAKRKYIGE
jgi:hypothetical protein